MLCRMKAFQPSGCNKQRAAVVRTRVAVRAQCSSSPGQQQQEERSAPHPLQRAAAFAVAGIMSASMLLPSECAGSRQGLGHLIHRDELQCGTEQACAALQMWLSVGPCGARRSTSLFPRPGPPLQTPSGVAEARLDPVNRPDLLPKEFTPVIDVAGFLAPSEEKRLAAEVTALERDTGFKLRVLAQSYPETPGERRGGCGTR